MNEFFYSFLHFDNNHLFDWLFDIDGLNASLGTNFLGGFEIWEKVTGFDDDLLVVFQEIYLTVQFLYLLLFDTCVSLERINLFS